MKGSFKKYIVRLALRLHNFSYRMSGSLSAAMEPDRLHPKHRLTDYHDWFAKQIRPEWVVLDIGCGNGALSFEVSRHCKKVIGIDISAENIRQAKARSGCEFICADVTKYQFVDKFDAAILSNVLEHIEDRVSFLKKASQYCERFIIRVPMIDRDWITLYKKEMSIDYRLDPNHFIEYTLADFLEELDKAGLKLESYRVRYGELYAVAGRNYV